jgi:hypothetical protein
MQVITTAQVKTLLGLTVTTYDTAITAAIPYIDSVVKQICRNRFNKQIGLALTDENTTAYVYSVNNYYIKGRTQPIDGIEEYLEIGTELQGTGITAGTFIQDLYYDYEATDYNNFLTLILSSAATADSDGSIVFTGINIAYKPIIANAVWWHTLQLNQTIKSEVWLSRTMGPLSVTKAEMDAKIDGKYGVPIWLVKALPHWHGGH